jgi:hypothetical protein
MTKFLTAAFGLVALALATTTPASARIYYFECGKQIIAGAWNKRDHFENSLVLDRNRSWTDEANLRELPRRSVKDGSDQPDADDPDQALCARKGPDNHAPCR